MAEPLIIYHAKLTSLTQIITDSSKKSHETASLTTIVHTKQSDKSILMHSISGYYPPRQSLKHWQPLCDEWILLSKRYSDMLEENPFGLGELNNVSLLAGAAWRCGYAAAQEFVWEKSSDTAHVGRADLYLCSPSGTDEFIEAKYIDLSLQARDFCQSLGRTFQAAKNDAIRTKNKCRAVKTVAIVFVRIHTKLEDHELIKEQIGERLPEIWKTKLTNHTDEQLTDPKPRKPDLLAWNFPESLWQFRSNDDYLLPGGLMIAQKIKETDQTTDE